MPNAYFLIEFFVRHQEANLSWCLHSEFLPNLFRWSREMAWIIRTWTLRAL